METTGPCLGLAPANLLGVLSRLPVVGQKDQVNSDPVAEAPDAWRQMSYKKPVDLLFQGPNPHFGQQFFTETSEVSENSEVLDCLAVY